MNVRILLLLVVVVTGLSISLGTREPARLSIADATRTDSPTFTEGFLEHLAAVQEAAVALVDLGERRERNLLVVGQRQAAMNSALDSTDAWLAQEPNHQDDAAVVAYRSGAASIRQAMAEAQSAFLRFDWDGVAAANGTLNDGVAEINAAVAALVTGDAS